MMTLDCFGPAFGLPDASPFCLKTIWLLKQSKQPWQSNKGADLRRAPMQKFPVLHDANAVIPDSDAIRTHLENNYQIDFDKGLDATQRAQSRALIRMAEEHMYFCLVYDRWKIEENWHAVKSTFFSDLPLPLRVVIPGIARKKILASLNGQGIGRMSFTDMLNRAEQDISAIEQTLGDKPYLFGETATAADASVGAVLAEISVSPAKTALSRRVLDSPTLANYVTTLWLK